MPPIHCCTTIGANRSQRQITFSVNIGFGMPQRDLRAFQRKSTRAHSSIVVISDEVAPRGRPPAGNLSRSFSWAYVTMGGTGLEPVTPTV
jgi:hypothetical protein